MHDMDRMRQEAERGIDTLESTGFEAESAYGYETFGEYGAGETGSFEFGQGEGVFSESQELELAAELLELSSEAELNQFLGKLIKSAGRAVGSFVKGPVGQAIGGVLKQAAGKVLPIAGAALGNMIVPGLGGVVGGKLASMAGSALGLELEGLSQEDREFEVARQFVRLAGETTRNAVTAPTNANPAQVAQAAFSAAARTHAPGLAPSSPNGQGHASVMGATGAPHTGRWIRRGRRIILLGL